MGIKASVKIPAGTMIDYAGGTPPAGWLECAGQAVSRSTYAALFLAIGTTHGVGDGSTTFNVPDARGRVVFGKDNMNGSAANRLTTSGGGVDGATLGAVGGAETRTLTTAQIPTQTYQKYGNASGVSGTSDNGLIGGGSFSASPAWGNISGTTAAGKMRDTNTGGAHAVTPPALVAFKIIKI